jgi:DnaJ like chaperone protein
VALAAAYRVLGVEPGAPDKAVKDAYRRLVNEHHPDKQAARGLPESMREVAKERTREILAAYELVRAERGLK